MACENCKENTKVVSLNIVQDSNCVKPCQSGNPIDSSCATYTGPDLPCSGVQTNDSVQDALVKIDSKLCENTGDYSTYNTGCLSDDYTITDEASFVNAITDKVCADSNKIDTINNITIPNVKTDYDTKINALNTPALTFASSAVVSTDNVKAVLSKFGTNLAQLNTNVALSGVNWNTCGTSSSTPSNLSQAFTLVLNKICSNTYSGGTQTLTFDNTNSCLPAPVTTSDSLYDTVNKIKTRLCQSPVFSVSSLNVGSCFGTQTDLQSTVQTLITKSNTSTQNTINQTDGNLSIDYVDASNPCLGKKLSLSSAYDITKVKVSSSDTASGYLSDKLQAGSGVTLDTTTTPGVMIINSIGSSTSKTVSASSTDNNPGYLIDKLEVGASVDGISLGFAYNSGTGKVTVTPTVDLSVLFTALIGQLSTDSTLSALFCSAVSSCPGPCASPTNISAIQVS